MKKFMNRDLSDQQFSTSKHMPFLLLPAQLTELRAHLRPSVGLALLTLMLKN